MVRNFLDDIEELSRGNVHIKDRARVDELLRDIVKGGFKSLQIVSDFDRTITKQHDGKGELHISSFGIFRQCPSLSASYLEQCKQIFAKYNPIENDPNIPLDEKKQLVAQWYKETADKMSGMRVPLDELRGVLEKMETILRDGSKKLFDKLAKNDVPILVFSAGLGDCVVMMLEQGDIYLPNVKVISNFLDYDDDHTILGFKGELIHVFSKNEYALRDSDYFEIISKRNNVILLGDSVGDAGMADGIDHANAVLKIAFLYEKAEENLPLYMEHFDIVLEDDQTMDVINAIIERI